MSEIKRLWLNKHTPQGRIDITVFFVNIFLLICHLFLMGVYIVIKHKPMIYINIISLVLYTFYIFKCYRNVERYMGISFLEIWIHLIGGILSFGWRPCYQNWCFAMIVAYFLPAFSPNKSVKRSFIFAFLIIFTYFFMATFYPLVHFKFTTELDLYRIYYNYFIRIVLYIKK